MSCEKVDIKVMDGVILSGTLYRPASKGKKLTILKSDPYGEDIYSTNNDIATMFQELDCNYLYTNVRGTGNSEGIVHDEYSKEEKLDMLQILEFIIEQPWSNGQICLFGISYSACNALHTLISLYSDAFYDKLSKLRRTVVSAFLIHVSYDNYKNDIHWNGGVYPISDSLQYTFAMIASNMRNCASKRCFNCEEYSINPDYTFKWLTRSKKYWYSQWRKVDLHTASKIEVPIFIYGGFHDLYCESAFILHKVLKYNVTVISDQGHETPNALQKLFAWWQSIYPSLKTRNLFCFLKEDIKQTPYAYKQTSYASILLSRQVEKYTHYFGKNTILKNHLNIGPFFRFAPSKVYLNDPLTCLVSVKYNAEKIIICGQPMVQVHVKNAPTDFYLVAWIFDCDENLLTIGTQRYEQYKRKDCIVKISLAPFCTRKNKFKLCLTMSCVPMLVPQSWNSELEIVCVKCIFPLATFIDLPNKCLPFSLLTDKANELSRYKIEQYLSKDGSEYTASSIEETRDYSEYFYLITTTKKTRFIFREVYYFQGGKVDVKCCFSSKGKYGQFVVYKTITCGKSLEFKPLIINFHL